MALSKLFQEESANRDESVSSPPSSSSERLWYLFGLLIAFQWCVFMIMVGVEVSSGSSSSSSITGRARDLRMMMDQQQQGLKNRTLLSACFTEACLEQVAQGLARTYPSRNRSHPPAWCISSGRRRDAQDRWQGLILVKGQFRMDF